MVIIILIYFSVKHDGLLKLKKKICTTSFQKKKNFSVSWESVNYLEKCNNMVKGIHHSWLYNEIIS